MKTEFLIGVISSLVATGVLYMGRFHFGMFLNFIFYRFFPNVSGKYLVVTDFNKYGGGSAIPKQKAYVYLSQTANLIRGRGEVFSGDDLFGKFSITGTISPSRILRIMSESKTPGHHQFGVGLYKLNSDGSILSGHASLLCASCEDTLVCPQRLERIKGS